MGEALAFYPVARPDLTFSATLCADFKALSVMIFCLGLHSIAEPKATQVV
jgi:hypothetical protein